MNEASVRAFRLPEIRTDKISNYLARSTVFKLFESMSIGSVTLHEGNQTFTFGDVQQGDVPHAKVSIHDTQLYRHLLLGGSIGAGESYMQGHWSSTDLTVVIQVFCANMHLIQGMDANQSMFKKICLTLAHILNKNTLTGSRRNISAHYDLGNEFFELFLDSTIMYSSAVFPNRGASLETASAHKLHLICQDLQLSEDDHLLEIGTGWGGMAIHAAKHYGCKVTTTTISQEQYKYACQRVSEEGLDEQIILLCKDYRELEGSYDKLVSIEMIEAVGHNFYQNYFSKCSSLLKSSGKMVIQSITMTDQRYKQARDSVDFIKRYIFPGGCLPSIEVISKHLSENTDMQMINLRDITQDYAETLAHWRHRFFEQLPAVREQGFDRSFERMWEFYLCYCEGGFRERVIGTVQLTFAKPGYRFD